jgi:protein O-GlcNAc transferase
MNARERNRLVQVAETYFRSGKRDHAKLVLDNLVAAGNAPSKAHELLGYIHGNAGDLALAHECLEEACRLPGRSAEALYYLGVSYLKQERFEAAISAFDKSLALAGAVFEALHDRGTAYSLLGDSASALQSYLKALRLKKDSFDLVFNIGKTYDKLKNLERALFFYDRALELQPQAADAWAHRGAVLYDAKRYAEAIANWERALAFAPDIEFLPGFLMAARLRLCDWSAWERDAIDLPRRVENGESACGPFELLALCGAERTQLKSSQRWVEVNSPGEKPAAAAAATGSGKIRIGYFSADFGRHAVSYLTAELYELHDRDRFEIFAFALERATDGDEMRARLVRAFDHFIDVKDKSDAQIVELARLLGIDIAVDLGGHTKGSRTGLFRDRVAPVQVNYLGYPGTIGAGFIDYMVADETTVPESSRPFYTERMAYLPRCFQPSDGRRELPASNPPRRTFGLPDSGFVFCCFNNSYKINPEVFGNWMTILRETEGSCLWLLADFEQCETNLRREAQRHGIDGARLVFGGSLPLSEYLGRYRRADLFLDTLPFNGGTTTNDALWAGVPVVTRPGDSFAARMAASLLTALDLPELIGHSREAYVSTAIRLARDPVEYGKIKARLQLNRERSPLFDMQTYTRHLEAAYREMHRRSVAGLPPDHIHVAQLPAVPRVGGQPQAGDA